MEQWEKDMNVAIDAIKKYMVIGKHYRDKGDRDKIIYEIINYKCKSRVSLLNLRYIIYNDTPDRFHLKGVFKYGWGLIPTRKMINKKYYQNDKDSTLKTIIEERNILVLKNIIEHYKSHYKDYSDSHLYYFLGHDILHPNSIKNHAKFGQSKQLDHRGNKINRDVPINMILKEQWEVDPIYLRKVELMVHKKIKEFHNIKEWYIDHNNTLGDIISNHLIEISKNTGIYIKKVIHND